MISQAYDLFQVKDIVDFRLCKISSDWVDISLDY